MSIGYNPYIVTSNLIMCLDAGNPRSYNGSGTAWFDISGRNNNGTLTNGPTYTSGTSGYFTFDGVNDFVNLGAPSGYLTNTGTLMFWIYPNATSSLTIFMQYSDDLNRMSLTHSNSTITAFSGYSTTILDFASAANSVPISTWTHVAYTYSFSTNAFAIYINGSLSNSVTDTDVPDIGAIGEITLGCGKDFDNPSPFYFNFYNGRLSNFVSYSAVLSATEIAQNFNAMRRRYGI